MKQDFQTRLNSIFMAITTLFVSQTSLAEAPYINSQYIRYCSGQWQDGDCQFTQTTVPDVYSVSELRNFVQSLDVRIKALETENTSLKKRLTVLEAYPSNQCTIEVVGSCIKFPSLSNKSFADSYGMLHKNSGLDLTQCQGRAKAYFDSCGGGVTVFATFTNSRVRYKFPKN